MASTQEPRHYGSETSSPESAIAAAALADTRHHLTELPDSAATSNDVISAADFANLLARAVQQFRTYPATNPRCEDAVAACHKALTGRGGEGNLLFRVHPRELIVGDTGLGGGTVVEQELARRLHRADVAALSVDTTASPRELSRFCRELIANVDQPHASLADTLTERGVQRIVPVMAKRPEVLDLGLPEPTIQNLVALERRQARAAVTPDTPAAYLYPPDRGWVRVDPTVAFEAVSLTDLAILVDDPGELAMMLLRLTDDIRDGSGSREIALEQKFSDVAKLFESLNPQLARLMFSKLAGAVLSLSAESRTSLLKRTILPGLLDGRVDGQVLRDFPDVDLAESLCLLMDLETAAPELLTTALDRLDLTPERRQAVAPLLEGQAQGHQRAPHTSVDTATNEAERRARERVQVDATGDKSFLEFASFDLSMDEAAVAGVGQVREGIGTTDHEAVQLQCLLNLVRLQPNPTQIEVFLHRVASLLDHQVQGGRWEECARWMDRFRQSSDSLREARPDVTDAITAGLAAFFTRKHVEALQALRATDDGRRVAESVLQAIGSAVAVPLIQLLDEDTTARSLCDLMCENAKLLAPRIGRELDECQPATARVLVRVLGHAGAGYEAVIARYLTHEDGATSREALRALVRVGTADAARLVAAQIQQGQSHTRRAAEDTLWRFPVEHSYHLARQLLLKPDFVRRNPRAAARLLERAGRVTSTGLEPVLAGLLPLRFRIWNPDLVRVGLKARRMLAQ